MMAASASDLNAAARTSKVAKTCDIGGAKTMDAKVCYARDCLSYKDQMSWLLGAMATHLSAILSYLLV